MPKTLHLVAGDAEPPRRRPLRARPGRALSQTGSLPDEECGTDGAAWFAEFRNTGRARGEVAREVIEEFWDRESRARATLRRVKRAESIARAKAEVDRLAQERDAEIERRTIERAADPALQMRAAAPLMGDPSAPRGVTVVYRPSRQPSWESSEAADEAFVFRAVASDGQLLAVLRCSGDPHMASAAWEAMCTLLDRLDPPGDARRSTTRGKLTLVPG